MFTKCELNIRVRSWSNNTFLMEHWTHDLGRSRRKNGATSCTKEDRKEKKAFTYVHFPCFTGSEKMSLKTDVWYRKITDPALEVRIVKPSITFIFLVLFAAWKLKLLLIHWQDSCLHEYVNGSWRKKTHQRPWDSQWIGPV